MFALVILNYSFIYKVLRAKPSKLPSKGFQIAFQLISGGETLTEAE